MDTPTIDNPTKNAFNPAGLYLHFNLKRFIQELEEQGQGVFVNEQDFLVLEAQAIQEAARISANN